MPKDKKMPNFSSPENRVRFSPYSNNCGNPNKIAEKSWDCGKDHWEDARCPICMEHPHNSVLLICSSHEKGCRPYMCDTSRRHSNCLDQFCKLHSVIPLKCCDAHQPNKFVGCGEKQGKEGFDLELFCPLCRGKISGWTVVESARRFMNSIVRGCALETCDFSGKYSELRKHARAEHPLSRPCEVDEERVSYWNRLEEEMGEEDAAAAAEFGDEDIIDDSEEEEFGGEDDIIDESEEEKEGEVNLEPLYPGDDFFNHIHFGNENDTVLKENYSISDNGILTYTRATTTGKFYEFAAVLNQHQIDRSKDPNFRIEELWDEIKNAL